MCDGGVAAAWCEGNTYEYDVLLALEYRQQHVQIRDSARTRYTKGVLRYFSQYSIYRATARPIRRRKHGAALNGRGAEALLYHDLATNPTYSTPTPNYSAWFSLFYGLGFTFL